jgi:P22_AR N-terminal domain
LSDEQAVIPVEQHTLMFYGKPIIVVRLPDGQPAVIIRPFCDNLQIDTTAQIARIRRTEVIEPDLVTVQVQTSSGIQNMNALVLHGVPFWLAGIDSKRVKDEEIRAEIIRYQREVVDVLYAWASSPRAVEAPKDLVPAEPITQPVRPAQDAPLAEWRDYYQRMAALIEWQMDVENWRGSVETRLEGIETIIPDILDRLPPLTITPTHQLQVRNLVKQLSDLTGKHQATIYADLYTAFAVPRYQDLPEAEWNNVERWFKTQIERARQRKKGRP